MINPVSRTKKCLDYLALIFPFLSTFVNSQQRPSTLQPAPCCSFILLLSLALMRSVCCAALHVVTVQHQPIRGRHPPARPMRGSPCVMMNVQTGEWRLEWVWRGSMEADGRSSFSTDSARNTENTENTENTGLQRLTETQRQ